MDSESQLFSDLQDLFDDAGDVTELIRSEHSNEEAINSLKETLSEVTYLNAKLAQQVEELRADISSQATILNNLQQHSREVNKQLYQLSQQLEELPDPVAALAQPLQQIQEYQRILIKPRRQQLRAALVWGTVSFSPLALAGLLVAQGVLVALLTVFMIHLFPPKAIAPVRTAVVFDIWRCCRNVDGEAFRKRVNCCN